MQPQDRFQNCTPHAIRIIDAVGSVIAIPASGQIARVMTEETEAGIVGGIRFVCRQLGKLVLPPRETVMLGDSQDPISKYMIVSTMVLDHPDCPDYCCSPDTGPSCVRENGQVQAVTRMIWPSPRQLTKNY